MGNHDTTRLKVSPAELTIMTSLLVMHKVSSAEVNIMTSLLVRHMVSFVELTIMTSLLLRPRKSPPKSKLYKLHGEPCYY